jgi:hypothetical protein
VIGGLWLNFGAVPLAVPVTPTAGGGYSRCKRHGFAAVAATHWFSSGKKPDQRPFTLSFVSI